MKKKDTVEYKHARIEAYRVSIADGFSELAVLCAYSELTQDLADIIPMMEKQVKGWKNEQLDNLEWFTCIVLSSVIIERRRRINKELEKLAKSVKEQEKTQETQETQETTDEQIAD